MLLSVVIPYYHVEKYIGECLARCAQLPEELCEILLVDDCGTDGSARIAADFCAKHANMRVIRREENGGLSAARNTGLEQAVGEYVYFPMRSCSWYTGRRPSVWMSPKRVLSSLTMRRAGRRPVLRSARQL